MTMDKPLDKLDEFMLGSNGQGSYSEIFLEHALRPKNAGNMENASAVGSGHSPDGSGMEIWLQIEDEVITSASFWTDGCATTIACGSMAAEMAAGKTIRQALGIAPEDIDGALGGVPGQGCTCARLAADALKAAIRDYLAFKHDPWKRKYNKK
jgi:NifU-like protein involved in Fe-S cluster formation